MQAPPATLQEAVAGGIDAFAAAAGLSKTQFWLLFSPDLRFRIPHWKKASKPGQQVTTTERLIGLFEGSHSRAGFQKDEFGPVLEFMAQNRQRCERIRDDLVLYLEDITREGVEALRASAQQKLVDAAVSRDTLDPATTMLLPESISLRTQAEMILLIDRLHQQSPASDHPHSKIVSPGHDAALWRALHRAAGDSLSMDFVVQFSSIARSAARTPHRVALGGDRGDPVRLYSVARRFFGPSDRIMLRGQVQSALSELAELKCDYAVTPFPTAPGVGVWWPALTERRFHHLCLAYILPVGLENDPEAAVFTRRDMTLVTPSGSDCSVFLAFDPHHRLDGNLRRVGWRVRALARSEPRVICVVDGFVTQHALLSSPVAEGLDGLQLLGSCPLLGIEARMPTIDANEQGETPTLRV